MKQLETRLLTLVKVERRCLGYCGKLFWSEGPHHRICSRCKKHQFNMRAFGTKVYRVTG